MLINLTNHPSANWSLEQLNAAQVYGEIIDYPFPQVSPSWTEVDIAQQSEEIVNEILSMYVSDELTIHLMGEFTLTYALVKAFAQRGITCIASTTERIVTESEPGKKTVEFRFVRFRRYQ